MELLGWIATLVVLVSFLFDGVSMRIINGVGALLWMGWGIGMEQGSVIVLNTVIVLIHIGKLLSIERGKKKLKRQKRATTLTNINL
jgi:hypothetical protein